MSTSVIGEVRLGNMIDDEQRDYDAIVDDLLILAEKIEAVIDLENESYRKVQRIRDKSEREIKFP